MCRGFLRPVVLCNSRRCSARGEAGEQRRATFFMGLCSNLVLNISYRSPSKLGESRRHTKGVELTQLSHSQSLNTKHGEQKEPVLRYYPLPLSPSRHPYSLAAHFQAAASCLPLSAPQPCPLLPAPTDCSQPCASVLCRCRIACGPHAAQVLQ